MSAGMRPAVPATQTPALRHSKTLNPVSMPSVMSIARRSLAGATTIGRPALGPSMILTGSIGALRPSGVSLVMWTPVTSAGALIAPGSGSSPKPNAAIMAGGCLPFAGR